MSDWATIHSPALLAASLNAFGQPVVYAQAAGAPVTITGVLDTGLPLTEFAPGLAPFNVLSINPLQVDPVSGVPLLSGPPATGDLVTIGSQAYVVTRVNRDEEGLAILTLTEQ